MIGTLTGRLLEKSPAEILLDVGGVGYRVAVPLTTYGRLPEIGSAVTLSIHTHVREDALALFGFATRGERDLFERLIAVPGIGPRLALAILSHMEPGDLLEAVRSRDIQTMSRVPGIGRKTAERLLLELDGLLKSRAPDVTSFGATRHGGARADLFSAMENLGYRPAQIGPVVDTLLSESGRVELSIESLLREALRRMAAPARSRKVKETSPADASRSSETPAGRPAHARRAGGRGTA